MRGREYQGGPGESGDRPPGGDVRRFLLKGGKLTDPAIGAGNREPLYAADRGGAALLYHQRDRQL